MMRRSNTTIFADRNEEISAGIFKDITKAINIIFQFCDKKAWYGVPD